MTDSSPCPHTFFKNRKIFFENDQNITFCWNRCLARALCHIFIVFKTNVSVLNTMAWLIANEEEKKVLAECKASTPFVRNTGAHYLGTLSIWQGAALLEIEKKKEEEKRLLLNKKCFWKFHCAECKEKGDFFNIWDQDALGGDWFVIFFCISLYSMRSFLRTIWILTFQNTF